MQYFEKDDVSPERYQRTNSKLLQSGTGTWFLICEEFRAWLNGGNPKLWIYGIPGAGKTVLMALIIHMIPEKFYEDHVLAYYYCDYKIPATQDPRTILGSLAKQIALQDRQAFAELEELYRQVSKDGDIPRSAHAEDLRDLIMNMTKRLSDVFFVVDGLDECSSERSVVIDLLDSLKGPASDGVRLLFASRDEQDIRMALRDYHEISIAAKSSDIRLYVAAELQRRVDKGSLVLRNPSLKEHIMERLVEKADGM